jgi:hypothetical protein
VSAPHTVLLVGASGVFGRRLAERIIEQPGIDLILAARGETRLEALRKDLRGPTRLARLDRSRVSAAQLRRLGASLVIDAAGPFQASGFALVEAAIEAGAHYIDLADGRDYVMAIGRFDRMARARGLTVLSGASTTPALSHAVLDRLTAGWRRIDDLLVAVSPGNRAPRGPAVTRAIFSYVGQPVRVFRAGGWTTAPGWGLTRRLDFPGLGERLVSLCETPDLDLLVERYRPTGSAEFLAGLELKPLHRGLALASAAVRRGLIPSLTPFVRPALHIASLFNPFGEDRGGMVVRAQGLDGVGQPQFAEWSLAAEPGRGPHVPTLPALALLRRLCEGRLDYRGAGPCVGLLALDDFETDFAHHGYETRARWGDPSAPPPRRIRRLRGHRHGAAESPGFWPFHRLGPVAHRRAEKPRR